jgi:hypothetical protein
MLKDAQVTSDVLLRRLIVPTFRNSGCLYFQGQAIIDSIDLQPLEKERNNIVGGSIFEVHRSFCQADKLDHTL